MVLSIDESVRERVRKSATTRLESGLSVLSFAAMGTCCRVLYPASASAGAREFPDRLLTMVADFESKYSRFLENSLVGRINTAAGRHWVDVDAETERLLDLCGNLFFMTRGAFDPTALPLIRLWNWKQAVVPADAAIESARSLSGWNKVQRRPGSVFLPQPGMSLDFGGIGKEYAVDLAVQLAAGHGLESALVDFGQDIRGLGKPPGRPAWHVGLEDPRQPGSCWASVAVVDRAVATSGDYLRHFVHGGKRYGHIIDPRTGYPVQNACRSVSVVAPTCTIAGVLTTTAFILGPHEGFHLIRNYHGASGAVVTETGNLVTPQFHEYLVQKS